MCVVKDELELILKHPDLRTVPILFYANKSDVPKCWSALQCAQALQLDEIKVRSSLSCLLFEVSRHTDSRPDVQCVQTRMSAFIEMAETTIFQGNTLPFRRKAV
jgi:hypothetical protein